MVTNLSGSSIDCNTLYPYGEQDTTICTTSNSIWDKFTGYRLDPETGLEYAHARYYNPSLGRFMSPDPLGGDRTNPQSLNRYAYVVNNPINYVDPSGLLNRVTDGATPYRLWLANQPVCFQWSWNALGLCRKHRTLGPSQHKRDNNDEYVCATAVNRGSQ